MGGYDNPKTFGIDWSSKNLKVYSIEDGNFDLIMKAPIVSYIPIEWMAVNTGWGSEGTWNIQLTDTLDESDESETEIDEETPTD